MEPKDIEAAALALSRSERADLAARLVDSLDEHEPADPEEIERLCLEEVERRHQRYLAGETQVIPLDEAIARVRARVRRV
jgi:putative addiction module component (TIGR02574 family)